jgi:hypothetical protein
MNRPEVITLDAAGRPGSAIALGHLGHVSGQVYSFTTSGGAEAYSCNLTKPASYRRDAFVPGRKVRVTLGASDIWTGILDKPQPSDSGWAISAHGAGQMGGDYRADYDTWDDGVIDAAVNNAIARGLDWVNPGIGTPQGMWLGQKADPGSLSVAELLDLVCTRGGLVWYVSTRPRGNVLSVTKLPTTVNRLLVANGPVARTLGGDINALEVRYKTHLPQPPGVRFFNGSDAPNKNINIPQFSTTWATDDASIARHGRMESFLNLESAPPMTAAEAEARGDFILSRYQRASWAGPWNLHHGQLLTTGGHPVNLAAEQARTCVRLMLSDGGYGGEVIPGSPKIVTGRYEYSVDDGVGQLSPLQLLRQDFSSLMSVITETRGHGVGDWQRR